MNRWIRRCFVYLLFLGLILSIAVFPLLTTPVSSKTTRPIKHEIRGVWLTNVNSGVLFVPWGIERALKQLSSLNFNTIYPVVWNRGYTFYNSKIAKKVIGKESEPFLRFMHGGKDVLSQIIKLSAKKGITVIPWFEYGFMTPPNSELALLHPDWLTKGRVNNKSIQETALDKQFLGNRYISKQAWLNPLHPEVQKLIKSLILEVVSKYNVNGFQVDDHFGMPVQFGYDPFTIKLYQLEHQGKTPPDDPYNSEWMRWRSDKITAFMREINRAVKAVKPKAKISLSPNPQNFAYKYYLQDWDTWVKTGLVDELILQVYRDDTKSFFTELQQPAVQFALGKIPVAVGISSGTWGNPVEIKQIKKQVETVRQHQFSGVSFFYWESLWGYIAPEAPQKRRRVLSQLFNEGSS
jgi:uncharacterized lipoprotein YddW (UPF0748 family)